LYVEQESPQSPMVLNRNDISVTFATSQVLMGSPVHVPSAASRTAA